MREAEAIFVIINRFDIIAPALRDHERGESVELVATNTLDEAKAAFAARHSDIAVVELSREEGPELALAFARLGIPLVICISGSAADEAKLKSLAPSSFVLKADTPKELLRAVRAALG